MPFAATWMDSEVKMLSEVRERNIYHLYAESKKSDKGIYIQKRNRLTDTGNKLKVFKGDMEQARIN